MHRSFVKIRDIGVAKYTGEPSSGWEGTAEKIWDFFSRDKSDTDEGHYTKAFDWNGSTIWTGCDVHLAANSWRVNTGELEARYKGETEQSYATLFTQTCGGGVVFGNGVYLYYSEHPQKPVSLISDEVGREFALESVNTVSFYDGSMHVFMLGSAHGGMNSLEIIDLKRSKDRRKFEKSSIRVPEHMTQGHHHWGWIFQSDGSQRGQEASAFLFSQARNTEIDSPRDLILYGIRSKSVSSSTQVTGLQGVSKHPNLNVIATLGKLL